MFPLFVAEFQVYSCL